MPLIPGDIIIDRYRIEDLLAQGGMSAVYRAWDVRLQLPRALKEMVPYPGMDDRALAQLKEQFFQEAQVLAELRHPNMPRVIDHFEDSDNAYLVMDYVDGQRLDGIIEEEEKIPPDVLLGWASELFDAVEYCHEEGVLHRDVKPQNVIITPEGAAMLVDFGLAKLLEVGDRQTRTVMRGLGTPEYAPPEQYDAEPGSTDERSDIYGLGATLFHALTGTAPPTATQRIVDPTLLKPVRHYLPDISPHIDEAIFKALALQPDQRFRTVAEMAAALFGPPIVQPASQPLGSGARPTSDPLGTVVLSNLRRIPRLPLWAGAGGGVLMVAAILFIVLRNGLLAGTTPTATPTTSLAVAAATATFTPSPSATASATPTETPTATASPTLAPTETPTPTYTATPTSASTPPVLATPSNTATPTVTQIVCSYGVELVEVIELRGRGTWFVPSGTDPTFDLVLRNSGDCDWVDGTQLRLVSEDIFDSPGSWDVGPLGVGLTTVVTIDQITAPDTPGSYPMTFQLELPDGRLLDTQFTHDLLVSIETPTPTPTRPSPTPTSGGRPPQPTSTPSRTPTVTPTVTLTPTQTRVTTEPSARP